MSGYVPYALLTAVFLVGIYCIVSKKSLIKIVVGLAIAECAVNLFLVTLGYQSSRGMGQAPIETAGMKAGDAMANVDPLPQALVLTSIVIGLGTLALAVAICIRLYDRYRTYDVTEIKRLRG